MTFQSRAKGAAGERELASVLNSMGYHARRSQQFCGANSDSDVIVEEMPTLLGESKRVERLNIHEAMGKAVSDAAPHAKTPVVCHRKNNCEWLLTIRLADLHTFCDVVRRGMERRSFTGGGDDVPR